MYHLALVLFVIASVSRLTRNIDGTVVDNPKSEDEKLQSNLGSASGLVTSNTK